MRVLYVSIEKNYDVSVFQERTSEIILSRTIYTNIYLILDTCRITIWKI